MRELRVEDALMYLDQVKMEFGDRPHIYNEFLDIMKTFKSQTIDTPGVIRRVASLFHGNKRLVLGFNTFLPEGYRIELPLDGSAWPVYREPGRSGVIAIAPPAGAGGMMPGQQGGGAGGASYPTGGSNGGPRGPPPTPPGPRTMRPPGPASAAAGHPGGMPGGAMAMGRGGGVGGGHPPSSGMQQQQHPHHHLQQQQQQPPPPHGMARAGGPPAMSQFGAPPPTQRPGSVGVASYPGAPGAHTSGMLKGPPPPSQRMGPPMHPPSHHPPPHSTTGRGPPSMHPGPPPTSASGIIMGSGGAQASSHAHPASMGSSAPSSSSAASTTVVGGAGAAQPIEFDHAINYVTTIKRRFASHPEIYRKFLEILHTYQKEQRGIKEVLDEVSVLFADHADLLKEFTYFLPDAVQSQAKAQLDVAAKKAEDRARAREQQHQQSVAAAAAMAGSAASASTTYNTGQMDASTTMLQHHPHPASTVGGGGGPDHSIMAQHQHHPHPTPNLPPPPPPPFSSSSTGGRYGAGHTLHPSPRSEPTVPSHIAKIPFGATKGRSEDREREISRGAVHGIVSFGPARPPRRNELNPAQAAQLLGRLTTIPPLPLQPMTSESTFMEHVKSHFLRSDLFPDKPIVNRKQTPYMEFLKCLHLFAVGIVNKDELIQLLRGLFIQGNIPKNASNNATNVAATQAAMGLLTELERVLIGRGPFATQEHAKKLKGKYGGYPIREYEYADPSTSAVLTPSYRAYPADYVFDNSAEMEKDDELLNYKCYCVARSRSSNEGKGENYLISPEYYDGIKLRCNIHEEVLARVEDEMHEVDMAIERNASAMRVLEPVSEEATRLREQEERDGQPIGRLQYKLRTRALNSIHIGAIARVYGDSGEEILQHLLRNPLVVVPIVFKRLKEKNNEWRKVKKEMNKEWKKAISDNFAGSLESKHFVYKREIEQCFASDRLVEDCVRAKSFAKHPSRIHQHPATNMILPDFHLMNSDPVIALFQPHLSVLVSRSMPHGHAFELLNTCVSRDANELNQNSRSFQCAWKFISSWFGLPSQNTPGDENLYTSSELQYTPGTRVRTPVGDGQIVSLVDRPFMRYLVKFEYGIGYVLPRNVVEPLPISESDMSAMNDDVDDDDVAKASQLMPDDIQVLFGTEKMYLFMRLYILLVTMLYQAKDAVDRMSAVPDKQDLFSWLVSSLKDLLIGKTNGKAFEDECKKNLEKDVYNYVAIPPLVVKCAAASIRMAKEAQYQDLYLYSQLKLKDLKKQRNLSLEITHDAVYRLQIQSSASQVFFAYLPADAELQLTNPMDANTSETERRPLAKKPEPKRMKTDVEHIKDSAPP